MAQAARLGIGVPTQGLTACPASSFCHDGRELGGCRERGTFMLTMARRSPDQRPGPTAALIAPVSYIGPKVGITGVLEIDGELVIAGVVRGRIAATKFVIAAGGY